jgi:hypothetical protein
MSDFRQETVAVFGPIVVEEIEKALNRLVELSKNVPSENPVYHGLDFECRKDLLALVMLDILPSIIQTRLIRLVNTSKNVLLAGIIETLSGQNETKH